MFSKKYLAPLFILLSGVVAILALSCGNRWRVDGQRVIAYVNGQQVSYAEYDSLVKSEKIAPSTPEENAKMKRRALDELIDTVLVQQQVNQAYDALNDDPSFAKKRDEYLEKPVLKLLYDREIAAKVQVSDEDVEKYYQANLSRYKTPEQVRASHILIKVDIDSTQLGDKRKVAAAEAKAKKKADDIYQRLMKGEDFATLAKEFSDDPGSATRGGDLGSFSKGRMAKPFEDAAFSMEVGTISQPVKSEFGYHIIKVVEHRQEETKPLDDSRKDQIRQSEKGRLERDKAEAFVDSVKNAATYVFNEPLLGNDEDSTLKDDTWVATINGHDTLDYARYKDQKPKYMRFKNLTELTIDDKKEMLKTLAVNDILVQIALSEGLFQDSTIAEQGKQFTLTQARNKIDELMVDKNFSPTDSALQAYFDEHLNEFIVEKPLHVYHIIFTDSLKAEAIYDSIKNGADFVEMAKRYYPGEPEIREVAYDLDFISEKEMPSEFWKAASALQVGSVSPPVKTEWGWHVIKLVSRKNSKTFEQVKPSIRSTLQKDADEKVTAKYLARLREKAEIQVNGKLLDEYALTIPGGMPTFQLKQE